MPVNYDDLEVLHEDAFETFDNWHHEGIGEIAPAPDGGMRLHCHGSRQGGQGCMAFFRPNLPDQIAFEYDITIRSHGGLVINYIAIRGLNREDMIRDHGQRLAERNGIMANYYDRKWGLQSYHVSFSRFNDDGVHTSTSNWRRNPGGLLAGHGIDPCCELDRTYRIRITKDEGHCQFYVDGVFAHGFIDRDILRLPLPSEGKFGFRTIGSDVKVDIANFKVSRIPPAHETRSFNGLF
jgi:hypothetical protein